MFNNYELVFGKKYIVLYKGKEVKLSNTDDDVISFDSEIDEFNMNNNEMFLYKRGERVHGLAFGVVIEMELAELIFDYKEHKYYDTVLQIIKNSIGYKGIKKRCKEYVDFVSLLLLIWKLMDPNQIDFCKLPKDVIQYVILPYLEEYEIFIHSNALLLMKYNMRNIDQYSVDYGKYLNIILDINYETSNICNMTMAFYVISLGVFNYVIAPTNISNNETFIIPDEETCCRNFHKRLVNIFLKYGREFLAENNFELIDTLKYFYFFKYLFKLIAKSQKFLFTKKNKSIVIDNEFIPLVFRIINEKIDERKIIRDFADYILNCYDYIYPTFLQNIQVIISSLSLNKEVAEFIIKILKMIVKGRSFPLFDDDTILLLADKLSEFEGNDILFFQILNILIVLCKNDVIKWRIIIKKHKDTFKSAFTNLERIKKIYYLESKIINIQFIQFIQEYYAINNNGNILNQIVLPVMEIITSVWRFNSDHYFNKFSIMKMMLDEFLKATDISSKIIIKDCSNMFVLLVRIFEKYDKDFLHGISDNEFLLSLANVILILINIVERDDVHQLIFLLFSKTISADHFYLKNSNNIKVNRIVIQISKRLLLFCESHNANDNVTNNKIFFKPLFDKCSIVNEYRRLIFKKSIDVIVESRSVIDTSMKKEFVLSVLDNIERLGVDPIDIQSLNESHLNVFKFVVYLSDVIEEFPKIHHNQIFKNFIKIMKFIFDNGCFFKDTRRIFRVNSYMYLEI